MDRKGNSILGDWLTLLGVPHTAGYTDKRFSSMPFKTLFGMTKLMEEYGVKTQGYRLTDRSELANLTPPFIAVTHAGLVIVTGVSDKSVCYMTQGVKETIPADDFNEVWNGDVVLAFPSAEAKEPDYCEHARIEWCMKAKKWVLLCGAVLLFAYFFITRGLYSDWSTVALSAIDIFGLYITYLLVQKSANIHSKAADRVCGVIQEGGCDKILATDASKFFGLFGWSEVGFAYFSVSLLAMLFFPSSLPSLALCNLICLPFSFWSVWYQRFRAHHWCTLCLCVQASLWLLFFCYLFGGWLKMAFPVQLTFVVLGVAYVTVMLAINALMPLIEKSDPDK